MPSVTRGPRTSFLVVTFGTCGLVTLAVSTAIAHEDDWKLKLLEPAVLAEPYRAIEGGVAGETFEAQNTLLQSWLPLAEFSTGATSGNDCWGYVSASGREYAFIGLSNGTGIAEVTNPADAQVIGFIPGPTSLWRDMKVFGTKCYVVTEGGGGIQVLELAQIDSGVVTLVGTQTAGGTGNTHNVAIDVASGFLYRCGGASNGLRIYDLNANPTNPPLVGTWPDRYVHDAQIVTFTSGPYAGRQIAFCCSGFNGGSVQTGLDILDVTNKSAIVQLGRLLYPTSAYSHQGWLSEDRKTFFLLDEQDEINLGFPTRVHVIDVSDLVVPVYRGTFTNGNAATTHNGYVLGNRLFTANYRSGLRVFDISAPTQASEIASFDTYPGSDASGYNGAWSCYPYFPSGTVIVSDMQRGLFVVDMVPQVASWEFPQGTPSEIDPSGRSLEVGVVAGEGFELLPGTARMLLTRQGQGTTAIPMSPSGKDLYVATFPAMECGESIFYRFAIDSADGQTSTSPQQGAFSAIVAAGVVDEIDPLETNTGWVIGAPGDTATGGIWERVAPIGTTAQPSEDHTLLGTQCFITGQHVQGQGAGFNDVDGGATTLTSPLLSAAGLFEARIRCFVWYSNNAGAAPNEDSMPVLLSNDGGATWVTIEVVNQSPGAWTEKVYRIADFLEPTDQMRLRLVARDLGAGSLVEAGIDDISIEGIDCGDGPNCPEDLDGDGFVSGSDLSQFLGLWGTKGGAADFNESGQVDGADLSLLLNRWGACP